MLRRVGTGAAFAFALGAGFALGALALGAGLALPVRNPVKFDFWPCFFLETILPCLFFASWLFFNPPEVCLATPAKT